MNRRRTDTACASCDRPFPSLLRRTCAYCNTPDEHPQDADPSPAERAAIGRRIQAAHAAKERAILTGEIDKRQIPGHDKPRSRSDQTLRGMKKVYKSNDRSGCRDDLYVKQSEAYAETWEHVR